MIAMTRWIDCEEQMLLTGYLVSAVLFYVFVARRAPILQELATAEAAHPVSCEVIELFNQPAAESVDRAA
jgi:hypothetical protein